MKTVDVSRLTLAQREEIVVIAIQRSRANLLCFSDFCAKTACRRAHACSADPDFCIGQMLPFVPHEVREGVNALVEGRVDGMPYDAVRARAPQEVAAYEGWIEKINESRRGRAQARLNPKLRV